MFGEILVGIMYLFLESKVMLNLESVMEVIMNLPILKLSLHFAVLSVSQTYHIYLIYQIGF